MFVVYNFLEIRMWSISIWCLSVECVYLWTKVSYIAYLEMHEYYVVYSSCYFMWICTSPASNVRKPPHDLECLTCLKCLGVCLCIHRSVMVKISNLTCGVFLTNLHCLQETLTSGHCFCGMCELDNVRFGKGALLWS